MKRKFGIFCSLLLALQMILSTAVMPVFAAEVDPPTYEEVESPAVTYNMNVDWKFRKAAADNVFPLATALAGIAQNGKNFYEVDYDDSEWETVSVPHPINADDSFDGVGIDAGEASLYRGFMFYRKNITIPETDADKKFILEFEAFRQSVYVYVNGEMVGYYEAGISPVGFDITDHVIAGQDNLIAVATDNASSRGSSFNTQETIPGHEPGDLSGVGYQWNTKDFNEVQGGITGNVNLYAKNKIYQTLPLYNNLKTTGNYIYGSNFDFRENSADISVEAEVRNETADSKDITLQVDVVDGDGNCIATFEETATVAAATDTETDQFLTVVPESAYDDAGIGLENNNVDLSTVDVTKIKATANVADLRFWSDKSPYLYTVYTTLKDGDEIIDSQKTVTGFREVKYDKDKGLQINGETTYLKGYAQRATNEWAAIGVANDWMSDIDMQLVKESNANFIRWMHVAPKPVAIRAGDKYGVISVAPAGDKEGDVVGRAWDQRAEAMRDTIIYFRNSPSVLFYEAGNNAITAEHMQEMTDLRIALDPDGDRLMGCRTITSVEQINAAEWVGTMLYRHDASAYASMESTGKYMPILETEYHRNEAPRRIWDDYSPPNYDYVNKWLGASGSKTDGYDIWDQTQEDFSRTMFNSGDGYSYYYNNRVTGAGKGYYSGAAMMVWSDSNMHVRNCGVENARTSGRVDPIRVKKESFYAIQAAQSDTPKVKILGHWNYPSYTKGDKENGNYWYEDKTFNGTFWEPNGTLLQRDPTTKTVYVIGSEGLSKVELYVNDKLVGTDTTATDNYIYAFDGIDVTQSGSVSTKAYNDRNEVVAEDVIKTVGNPATIRLTRVQGPEGFLADGSDISYVDVEVIDEEGNVCPLDERKITFTVSDETKATFLGGYNSGIGERLVNHKDYVFAECGINRVFLRSTREAGEFTLTANAEGMQPVSITVDTKPVELIDGLTTQKQQAFKQGEVPEPPAKETAPALKSLGESFTADWTEGTGNVVTVSDDNKDYYTVNVNGKEVTFTDKAYKPDSNTSVVGELNPILDALKAANCDFTYTYTTEGNVPEYAQSYGTVPYITINSGGNVIDVVNGSTDIFVNGERNLTNLEVTPNTANTALFAELSVVLGKIDGVLISLDEETKTLNITVEGIQISALSLNGSINTFDYTSSKMLSYSNGKVIITSETDLSNVNLLVAGYDENGKLIKVTKEIVNVQANIPFSYDLESEVLNAFRSKAMLWETDMSQITPICPAIDCVEEIKNQPVDGVYEYDVEASMNNCNAAIDNLVLSADTSPDGTAYLSNIDYDNNSKGVCLSGIDANSKADLMWEADVRFDADASGITPYDNGDKKLGTCVRRHDKDGKSYLAIQTGSTSFTDYMEIDPTKWYHIVLIGRFSAADAKTNMIVYEYDGSTKVVKGTYENVNQRNMSANNNNGASHWNVHKGTSVDNMRIVTLGADTLNVTSDAAEITAGNVMQFEYAATRRAQYITKPTVTWSVYDANNANVLADSNITIENGILNVGIDAASQDVYVRATAENGIYASKKITVKAVDISSVEFDTLTLQADKNYVSATEPLTITATATKGGQNVEIADSDLIWYVCDKENLRKLGDDMKWITVENGVVTVDTKAISQDITIRAADTTDVVRGAYAVHVKSSDALEGNEDGSMDRLLFADSCEAGLVNTELDDSAPDGTSGYKATASYSTGNITETSDDIVVEMDIKFNQEGAGFQPAKNGKINTCVIYHNGQLAVQTGSSSYTNYGEVDSNKWYHITLIRKKGSYAHIIFEEYDENGNRTNRRLIKDVNQRNNETTAFVNINAGTSYDNLRVLSPVPTDISVTTDVQTVFAGNTVQATATLLWNGLEMKNPDASMLEYKIYDSENQYPIDNNKITVDGSGLISVDAMADAQDVYVRAIAKKSGKYASAKFTVSSSDIITINQLGVNEDESKLLRLFITKNFYYVDEVTFVTEIIGADGTVKTVNSRQLYGDALKIGENTVSLNVDIPEDFNKETDTIKIFALTKVMTDDVTEDDGTLAVEKTTTGIKFTTVPTFDAGSDVLVLVMKADADETNLQNSDILYFNQVDALSVDDVATWSTNATGEYKVKVSGNVNGVLQIKATSTLN